MMERARFLIVMAGGSGTRMGASVPKQFLEIGGRPVLQMTIGRFVEAVPGLRVITVLPEDYVGMWKDLCYARNFSVPQTIVHGGLTRFHSVRNGLEKVPDGAVVAVHDGVRPMVSPGFIASMFRMGGKFPAVAQVEHHPEENGQINCRRGRPDQGQIIDHQRGQEKRQPQRTRAWAG